MNRMFRAIAALAILLLLVVAGTSNVTAASEGKVFVCKYVGTPGVDERLQTGQNPISVSVNAIPEDPVVIGSFFADAQGRSFVLAFDIGQPEPDVSECPGSETPSSEPSTTPSDSPSSEPSVEPSDTPSVAPSDEPTQTPTPTGSASSTQTSNVSPPPTDTATSEPVANHGNSIYLVLAAIFAVATSVTLLKRPAPARRRR